MLDVSGTLISVILCIAFLMPLLTDFGIMEFVGVLLRKVVRALFTVPGRSAIDLVTSWLGTSNAAAILTTGQYESGFYSAREAATISCNFSFVSIPFCYVIATLIGVEEKFTIFYLISLIGGVVLAMIIPRIPPLRWIPDTYDEISGKRISEQVPQGVSKMKWALNLAGHRAEGRYAEGRRTVRPPCLRHHVPGSDPSGYGLGNHRPDPGRIHAGLRRGIHSIWLAHGRMRH